jgi:hypothetical protein
VVTRQQSALATQRLIHADVTGNPKDKTPMRKEIRILQTLIYLSLLMIWSCNSNKVKTDSSTNYLGTDSLLSYSENTKEALIDSIHINLFKNILDSVIPKITGISKPFSLTVYDSLIQNRFKKLLWDGLEPDLAINIKRFDFINTNQFKIIVTHANYYDSIKTNLVFKKLRILAKDSAEQDGLPGLTYANDFVIRTNNDIFWLNAGCIYSYANFENLSRLFCKSINGEIVDSIKCECGGKYIE